MKVWGISEGEIRSAVAAVGVSIFSDWRSNGITKDGRALRFRLGLGTERVEEGSYRAPNGRLKPFPLLWQRASASPFEQPGFSGFGSLYGIGGTEPATETPPKEPRRIASVCWHGHYAIMRYLFAVRPEARIQTYMADYKGLENFLAEAPYTGSRNIGAPVYPVAMQDACYCSEHGRDDTDELDEAAEAWSFANFEHVRTARKEAEAKRAADFLLVGRVNYDPQRGV